MLRCFLLCLFIFILPSAYGQKLVEQKEINVQAVEYWSYISSTGHLKEKYSYLDSLSFYEITYLSDSLLVKGFIVKPKMHGKFPVVIFNRGGNQDFGIITPETLIDWLAPISRHGYTVIASQYRGSGGSQGRDEFGGSDINDVLNLLPVIDSMPDADTSRIGIYGWSRGGMMTYIALAKTNRFKAAIVGGAPTDLFLELKERPKMEEVYKKLIPGYTNGYKTALQNRSAIFLADKLSINTPILILHGKGDWRVSYQQAENMANKLSVLGRIHKIELYPNDDHILNQHRDIKDKVIIQWLDDHLKK